MEPYRHNNAGRGYGANRPAFLDMQERKHRRRHREATSIPRVSVTRTPSGPPLLQIHPQSGDHPLRRTHQSRARKTVCRIFFPSTLPRSTLHFLIMHDSGSMRAYASPCRRPSLTAIVLPIQLFFPLPNQFGIILAK